MVIQSINPSSVVETNSNNDDLSVLEHLFGRVELARHVASYLSVEAMFSLDSTSRFIRNQLANGGVWEEVEQSRLPVSKRPYWVKNAKDHARAVHEASRFAKSFYEPEGAREQKKAWPEMGKDVAYEFFDIADLQNRDCEAGKSRYEIFVRITSREDDQSATLYEGFPEFIKDISPPCAPISTHYLNMYVPSSAMMQSPGFMKLRYDRAVAARQFGSTLDIAVIAVHKNLPSRLVRATSGTTSEELWFGSMITVHPYSHSSFPTSPISSNEAFHLNEATYVLRCRFGVSTRAVEGGRSACFAPFVSLSFQRIVDIASLWNDLLAWNPEMAAWLAANPNLARTVLDEFIVFYNNSI